MIAEYSVTLENKTKSELILFIKELQDILKEKDREIDCLKKAGKATEEVYKRELEKKEKQIDLMAEYIATLDIEEDICSKIKNEHCDKMNFGECEDCIKQYFKSKAEKE